MPANGPQPPVAGRVRLGLGGPGACAGNRPENGEHLVIEVEGLEREQDRATQVGKQRLGRWRFEKLHSPRDLDRVM
jgi:hypothetical protein